jgi:hypothetical protein
MQLSITKYCQIKDNSLSINGKKVSISPSTEIAHPFLTQLYRESKVGYPKFFKMDNLAKTGFLAAEFLLRDTAIYGNDSNTATGIFMSNQYASLHTDEAYQTTIGEEYFPSPSIFVYTLPNIVMGEIAIKHKIFGENTFFVSEDFDIQSIVDYVTESFQETEMNFAIVGRVEYYRQHCEAFLMLVERCENKSLIDSEFTVDSIEKLYKS